jgi:hypothetical protein
MTPAKKRKYQDNGGAPLPAYKGYMWRIAQDPGAEMTQSTTPASTRTPHSFTTSKALPIWRSSDYEYSSALEPFFSAAQRNQK